MSGPGYFESSTSSQFGPFCALRYYTLEVVQHPLRARMCGFGDKVNPSTSSRPALRLLLLFFLSTPSQDRRPLAPAAVAKMIVYDDNNQIVDLGFVSPFFSFCSELFAELAL